MPCKLSQSSDLDELILAGDTRKIFVSNIIIILFKYYYNIIIIFRTVDESDSARVLVGCKPIKLTSSMKAIIIALQPTKTRAESDSSTV